MKVKSESEVAQLCLTLSDPMDYSPPGSSVHGIFQARVLEWAAIAWSLPCGPPRGGAPISSRRAVHESKGAGAMPLRTEPQE